MSSKNADAPRTQPFSPSTWSLTTRLTVLYSVSAFVVLLLAAGFSYWVLLSSFRDTGNSFLADEVDEIRGLLRDHPDEPKALEMELYWEDPSRGYMRHYVRILDENGRTLMETPHMAERTPPSQFPTLGEFQQVNLKEVARVGSDGTPFYLVSAWAQLGGAGRERRIIQVALDVSDYHEIESVYRRWIALVLVLGVIVSAAAGAAVARRGLRPLREMEQATQRITPTRLHERIGSSTWPRELAALAHAFDAMLGRLEESFNRLSQFSSDLAHELRTPINNLRGETEVALSKARTAEDYRQVLESNLEEYARLTRMVEELLFLARAENPATRIERSRFEVRKEIEAVVEYHDAVAQEQQIAVQCAGEGVVEADPRLFRRAFSNLLSNALRYSPRSSTISVTVTQRPDRSVEIRVSDTGPGIAAEHLGRIFDRFYRADGSRSEHADGNGLGLAIVKSIMDLHGGTARVESEVGKGTTAVLTFPSLNAQGTRVEKLVRVISQDPR